MATLHELVAFMDQLLDIDHYKDYCPKGLQVEGAAEVTRIALGVSACMPLFEQAVEIDAQMVLVHHGMLWDNEPKVVQKSFKNRLKYLLANDLSLVGYHLPLDAHPEVGNNAQIVDKLGLIERQGFGQYGGQTIAFRGRLPQPMAFDDFLMRVNEVFGGDAFHLPFGPGTVETVAVCSGGAPELVREALTVGADVYLTGEATEWVYHLAKEEGIHYIGAGHHQTERFGVMALGQRLTEQFGVECQFIDIPNPI